MALSLAETPVRAHLQRLEIGRPRQAKADLKNLEMERREMVGRAIRRAFELAGMSQKEAAVEMDVDYGQLGRWLSGAERPKFDALFSIPRLRQPLVIAIAEMAGQDVEIDTVITVRRRAA